MWVKLSWAHPLACPFTTGLLRPSVPMVESVVMCHTCVVAPLWPPQGRSRSRRAGEEEEEEEEEEVGLVLIFGGRLHTGYLW